MEGNRNLFAKLLCVALVAAIMLPAGRMLFPYVSDMLSGMQFQMLEAMASTALGIGLHALIG